MHMDCSLWPVFCIQHEVIGLMAVSPSLDRLLYTNVFSIPSHACGEAASMQVEKFTFLASSTRQYSSSCLQPLKRASMTSVEVTSFSLKNRFTTPCSYENRDIGSFSPPHHRAQRC